MKRLQKICLCCDKELTGRIDKKYCSEHCKSAYHYKKAQEEDPKFFNKVDNQLKLNRRISKEYNKAGKATVRTEVLKEIGFDPNFFTHFWKNKKGDVYLFCYEYGFLKLRENDKEKFVLVTHQDYMNSY